MVHPEFGTLQDAIRYAEAVADQGIDTNNATALAKMRNALINLEDAANEARKDVIEPALDNKMDDGDRVANLRKLRIEKPTVTDTAAAMAMLEDAGADPAEVIRINPRQFIDTLDGTSVDPFVVVDNTEYTQYRQD